MALTVKEEKFSRRLYNQLRKDRPYLPRYNLLTNRERRFVYSEYLRSVREEDKLCGNIYRNLKRRKTL